MVARLINVVETKRYIFGDVTCYMEILQSLFAKSPSMASIAQFYLPGVINAYKKS